MESLEEMQKRIRQYEKTIQELTEKKRMTTDPFKRDYLEDRIEKIVSKKKALEEFIFENIGVLYEDIN